MTLTGNSKKVQIKSSASLENENMKRAAAAAVAVVLQMKEHKSPEPRLKSSDGYLSPWVINARLMMTRQSPW